MREEAMETWKRRWPKLRTGRSYEGQPGTNLYPILRNHKSRRTVSTLIQMRTGHGYNRAYLSRIPSTQIETPQCLRPLCLLLTNTQTPTAVLQTLQTPMQSNAKYHQTPPTDMEDCHVHHQRTHSKLDIPRGDRNGHTRMALREQRFGM